MANEESGKNTATLQTYVNDMLSLQKHILEVVEHQYADANVKNDPSAYDLVGKLKSTLTHQVGELETACGSVRFASDCHRQGGGYEFSR